MSKKEQTKQHILQCAWQLFRTKGYQNTSTRDIAMAANVANGTVFSHFDSKLSILKLGFGSQLDDVLQKAASTDKTDTARDKMLHYAQYLFTFYLSQREFSKEILKHIIWQHEELEPQLYAFKLLLAQDSQNDMPYVGVIFELYFITLIQGLSMPQSTVNSMLKNLRQKLHLVTNQ